MVDQTSKHDSTIYQRWRLARKIATQARMVTSEPRRTAPVFAPIRSPCVSSAEASTKCNVLNNQRRPRSKLCECVPKPYDQSRPAAAGRADVFVPSLYEP